MPSLTPRSDNIESGRNIFINGNLDFWQRGTSFANPANGSFSADRYKFTKSNTITAQQTFSRSADVPTLLQTGFQSQYSFLSTVTTAQAILASGENIRLGYTVEGFDYAALHGRPVRFQFWVKSSIVGAYSVSLRNSAANRSYVTTFNISAASVWEKKTIDFVADSLGTWLFDTNGGLIIDFSLANNAAAATALLNQWQTGTFICATVQTNAVATNGATFQLAQLMLVPGSFSSAAEIPFSRAGRTISHELQMCQRYYEKSYAVDTAPGSTGSPTGVDSPAWNVGGNSGPASTYFKATKRSAPTTTFFNNATGASGSWTGQNSAGAVTNIGGSMVLNSATVNAFMGYMSAATFPRIWGEWVADSEL